MGVTAIPAVAIVIHPSTCYYYVTTTFLNFFSRLHLFAGNLCQVDVNECASSPCQNKGTCVDGVASFTCLCELPYSGPTCAEVLTPCSPNPCANHADCTHTADYLGYQCKCQPGWQGKRPFGFDGTPPGPLTSSFLTPSPCSCRSAVQRGRQRVHVESLQEPRHLHQQTRRLHVLLPARLHRRHLRDRHQRLLSE